MQPHEVGCWPEQVRAVDGRPTISVNSSRQLAIIGRSVDFRLCKGKSQVSQLAAFKGIYRFAMLHFSFRASSALSCPVPWLPPLDLNHLSQRLRASTRPPSAWLERYMHTCSDPSQVPSICHAADLSPDQIAVTAGQGSDCREPVDGSKTMYCKRHAAAMESQIAAMARPQLSEHHIASALRGFKPNSLCSSRPLRARWRSWLKDASAGPSLGCAGCLHGCACRQLAAWLCLLAAGCWDATTPEPGLQPAAAPC